MNEERIEIDLDTIQEIDWTANPFAFVRETYPDAVIASGHLGGPQGEPILGVLTKGDDSTDWRTPALVPFNAQRDGFESPLAPERIGRTVLSVIDSADDSAIDRRIKREMVHAARSAGYLVYFDRMDED